MLLPDSDPEVGPSWTLCVGDTWRPPIVGLLQEMADPEYWLQAAALIGISVSTAEVEALVKSSLRIINRICLEVAADGCPDLEPTPLTPSLGATYSKTYSFIGSNVPTGWTVERGTPEAAGVGDFDRAEGGTGWRRYTQLKLTFLHTCTPYQCEPNAIINSSPFTNGPFYSINFLMGSAVKVAIQSPIPDVSNFSPQLTVEGCYATVDILRIYLRLDEQPSQASLLGSSDITNVYVAVKTTGTNPLP